MQVNRLITALLLLALGAAPWVVRSQGGEPLLVPDDYPSIRQAIRSASEGAVVVIREGVYAESLSITRAVTLRGEGKVVLTNPEARPAILLDHAARVTIEGLELEYAGVGIELRSSSEIVLLDMALRPSGCIRPDSAIVVEDSDVVMSHSNIAGGDKAVSLRGSSKSEIVGSNISKGVIAGIFIDENSQARVVDSIIAENILAGVVLTGQAQAQIEKSVIENNDMDGVAVFASAAAVITESIIRGNGGCGVWAEEGASVQVRDNNMVENGQGDLCGAVQGPTS